MNSEVAQIKFDLCATISLLKLVDENLDLLLWSRLVEIFQRLADAGDPVAAKILAVLPSELPDLLLRRDNSLWEPAIYFRSNSHYIFLSTDNGDNPVLLMASRNYGIGQLEPSMHPGVRSAFSQLIDLEQVGKMGEVGKEKYFAFWISRSYDSLQRISQIRIMYDQYKERMNLSLAIHDVGNFIDPTVAFPFISEVRKIVEPDVWRKTAPVSINIIECLRFPWSSRNIYHTEMINFARTQAVYESPKASKLRRDVDFCIFLSIEAEKRQAINQLELFVEIIREISSRCHTLLVMFNGMTGNEEGIDFFSDIGNFENNIISELKAKFPHVVFLHLHNKTFLEKLKFGKLADFHITPLGNAMLAPVLLDVPGVVYNSPVMIERISWFLDELPSNTGVIPKTFSSVNSLDSGLRNYEWAEQDQSNLSYSLDVQKVVELCLSKIA